MPEIGEVRSCRLCGRQFEVRASTQVYCSRKCANDAYNHGMVQQRHGKHDDLSEETAVKKAQKAVEKARRVWKPVERELKRGALYREVQTSELLERQRREMEARRKEGLR